MAAGSAAVRRPALVVESGLHRAGGGALETTVDQALIRGLGTAFRVYVSGISSVLESGRRAALGHITSDGGSPSVARSRPG
jgi:phosphoribosylaminoimidazole (AIR) synthetase